MREIACNKPNRLATASRQRSSSIVRPCLTLRVSASKTAGSLKSKKKSDVKRSKNIDQASSVRSPSRLLDPPSESEPEELDAPSSPGNGSRKFGSSTYRALVLDLAYRPINVVSWLKALKMDMLGRAEVLEYYNDCCVVSAYKTFRMPAVMRVHILMDMSTVQGRVSLTRRNIMLRDKSTCQYCGAKNLLPKHMTIDHVIPVSLGGKNTWDNLVTACKACNQKKGSSSLKQLGWRLRTPLREPSMYDLGMVARGVHPSEVLSPPKEWTGYIQIRKPKHTVESVLKHLAK